MRSTITAIAIALTIASPATADTSFDLNEGAPSFERAGAVDGDSSTTARVVTNTPLNQVF